jgi:hypothetical protein
VKRYAKTVEPFFWRLAKAVTVESFQTEMQKLREHHSAAATYVAAIDPSLWATAYFPTTRFGYLTSNIVESANASLKAEREMPILQLLNEIWHRVMHIRTQRLSNAEALASKGQRFSDFAMKQLRDRRKLAGTFGVRMGGTHSDEAEVSGVNTPVTVFVVNFRMRTCTCKRYQENGIPCEHALAFILQSPHRSPDLEAHIPWVFSIDAVRQTYAFNLRPCTINDLPDQPSP